MISTTNRPGDERNKTTTNSLTTYKYDTDDEGEDEDVNYDLFQKLSAVEFSWGQFTKPA
jgi:hypothetical protein